MKKHRASIFFFFIIITSCSFLSKNNLQNRSYMYQKKSSIVKPSFKVHHNTKISSKLYYKINTNELLKIHSLEEKINKISYTIKCELYVKDITFPIDSFKISKDMFSDTLVEIIEQIEFQTKEHEEYLLKITFTDENKSTTTNHLINFERRNDSKENYLISLQEKEVYFFSYFNIKDTLSIRHNSKQKEIWINYYNETFPLAKPPFIVENINSVKLTPESVLQLRTDSTFFSLPINLRGIYNIVNNPSSKEGATILSFNEYFPNICKTDEMIPPLQFISSSEEFLELKESKNTKIALDKFWLSKTKDNEQQAKKLIHTFYRRVENANKFFTSYLEGWKTDRGMIYLIFGAPNIIYQTKGGERWIYGEKNNIYSLNFTFTKMKNKFTENDYQLNRSVHFRSIWNTAIESWRNGHIYSDIDIKKRIYEQERRQRQSQFYFWH